MKSAEQRKLQSIEKLKSLDIPYIDWLPVIEQASDVRVRTAEEIAQRAISCLITIQAAFTCNDDEYTPEAAQFYLSQLQAYRLDNTLTANEVNVLNNEASEQELTNMIWKYEAYWTLLWALGLVETLTFPNGVIDCNFAVDVVADAENFEAFMAKVKLRDIEVILDEADLIYRLHWACVNARLNSEEMPADMIESVVMERHAGLNWLIDNDKTDDWDNPDIST